MAVSAEVSVVSAMAGSGRRCRVIRPTNSAATCWASAALPPLPKSSSLWPPPSDRATRSTARSRSPACSARKVRCACKLSSKSARIASWVSATVGRMVGSGSGAGQACSGFGRETLRTCDHPGDDVDGLEPADARCDGLPRFGRHEGEGNPFPADRLRRGNVDGIKRSERMLEHSIPREREYAVGDRDQPPGSDIGPEAIKYACESGV